MTTDHQGATCRSFHGTCDVYFRCVPSTFSWWYWLAWRKWCLHVNRHWLKFNLLVKLLFSFVLPKSEVKSRVPELEPLWDIMGPVLVDFNTDRHAHVNTISAWEAHTLSGALLSNLPDRNTLVEEWLCSPSWSGHRYFVSIYLSRSGLQINPLPWVSQFQQANSKHFDLFWCLWMNNMMKSSTGLHAN